MLIYWCVMQWPRLIDLFSLHIYQITEGRQKVNLKSSMAHQQNIDWTDAIRNSHIPSLVIKYM